MPITKLSNLIVENLTVTAQANLPDSDEDTTIDIDIDIDEEVWAAPDHLPDDAMFDDIIGAYNLLLDILIEAGVLAHPDNDDEDATTEGATEGDDKE